MRSTITFDTLEYMDELKRSGIIPEQAEAITKATASAFAQMIEVKELSTKSDLRTVEIALKKDISELKIELMKCIHESAWKTIGIIIALQVLITGVSHFIK